MPAACVLAELDIIREYLFYFQENKKSSMRRLRTIQHNSGQKKKSKAPIKILT